MKKLGVLFIALCMTLCMAFEYDETSVLTEDGTVVKVENIHDNNKSISIIKKGGETLEIQSSADNERYTIVKQNNTCIVTFDQDEASECQAASASDDRYTSEELQEITKECEGYKIDFIKSVSCESEQGVQKRACYIRCYYYLIKRYILGRWRYYILRRCYTYCL